MMEMWLDSMSDVCMNLLIFAQHLLMSFCGCNQCNYADDMIFEVKATTYEWTYKYCLVI